MERENTLELGLSNRVAQCLDMNIEPGSKRKQNLVVWSDIKKFKEEFSDIRNKEGTENAIYQIFCGEDEKKAFKDATQVWGATYPLITFLFFLKDIKRYVHVRPNLMKNAFIRLGIESKCLNDCSWENYQEFLQILNKIQKTINKKIDPEAELIDAQSFLWIVNSDNMEGKKSKLPDEFKKINKDVKKKNLTGDERDAVVKVRVNQSEFRKRLIKRYGAKCCLCGVSDKRLLFASHIKAWKDSDRKEKIDVDNGFLLCPNHDHLFDKHLISFDDEGKIMISSKLSNNDRIFMNVKENMMLNIRDGNKKYLEFHRSKFNKKND